MKGLRFGVALFALAVMTTAAWGASPLTTEPLPPKPEPGVSDWSVNVARRTGGTILYNSNKQNSTPGAAGASYNYIDGGNLLYGAWNDSSSNIGFQGAWLPPSSTNITGSVYSITVGSEGDIRGNTTFTHNGGTSIYVDQDIVGGAGYPNDANPKAAITGTVTLSDADPTAANYLWLENGTISGSVDVVMGDILIDGTAAADAVVSGTIETSYGDSEWLILDATISGHLIAGGTKNTMAIGSTTTTTNFEAGSTIEMDGEENYLSITGNVIFDPTAAINLNSTSRVSAIHLKDMLTEYSGNLDFQSSEKNTLYLDRNSLFGSEAITTFSSTNASVLNEVIINTQNDGSDPDDIVAGVIDLSDVVTTGRGQDTNSTNVYIVSGVVQNYDHADHTILDPLYPYPDHAGLNAASIIGAGTDTLTGEQYVANIYVSGGTTTYADTNTGDGNYVFTNGAYTDIDNHNAQLFNVLNSKAEDANGDPDATALTAGSTAGYYNTTNMHHQMLNQGSIGLYDSSFVTIGAIEDHADDTFGPALSHNDKDLDGNTYRPHDLENDAGYSDHWVDAFANGGQAQITANDVLVTYGSKLLIHENFLNFGSRGIDAGTENIVNDLHVEGVVTLDRTTIQGEHILNTANPGDSTVTVYDKGVLHGFGVINSDVDHSARRENVRGDVTIKTGGAIQPYDRTLFVDWEGKNDFHGAWTTPATTGATKQAIDRLKGLVFDVKGGMTFEKASILSTRLFHDHDSTNTVALGGATPLRQYSDSVSVSRYLDFSDIWDKATQLTTDVPQEDKLIYRPVFGFNYELRSKQDFFTYDDNGDDDNKTYYYSVAKLEGGLGVKEFYDVDGSLLADANHLANRLILKSDMLGEWFFLPSDDGRELALRYRMQALHPTMGGLKLNMEQRGHENEIKPAQYLDELRYPFTGVYGSDIADDYFEIDPSRDLTYRNGGYDGDMSAFYAKYANPKSADYNRVYDNYSAAWIADWENFFQGVQLSGFSTANINQAIELITSETYANVTDTTLSTMQQFINLRERNAISALFQVENNCWRPEDDRVLGAFDPILDAGSLDRFVVNPARFWASAFGSDTQVRGNGSESGYDNRLYGGTLGLIKEWSDYYAGATVGQAYSTNSFDNLMGSESYTRSYLAEALLGARFMGLGFAEAHANYSYNANVHNRVVDLRPYQGLSYYGRATGAFASHVMGGGLRLGWQQILGCNWLLVPTLGVNVMHHRSEAFTEEGRWDMANRMVFDADAMDRTVVRVPVQVRLSRSFNVGDNVISPEIRAGFTPVMGDYRGTAEAEWLGYPIKGRKFQTDGAERGRYEASAGATLEWSRRGRYYVAANYDYTYTENSSQHNVSVQAGLNF